MVSATAQRESPLRSMTLHVLHNTRTFVSFQLAQFTTPMYRAPEMLDTWDNRKIDHSVDIWALGCILYTLCYMQHPFEDSAKLAILNGNYNLNPNDQRFKCFHEIISKFFIIITQVWNKIYSHRSNIICIICVYLYSFPMTSCKS